MGWFTDFTTTQISISAAFFAGIYTIMLKLDDGNNASTMEFHLNVINSNEAPNVSDLYVTCEEDASISFTLFASDFDGDDLIISIPEDIEGATFSIDGFILDIVVDENWYGAVNFDVTASDGIDFSATEFSVEVTPINDAPVWTDIPIQTIDEDPIHDKAWM